MTETDVLDFSSGASVSEEYKKKEDAARAAARGSQKYFSLKQDQESAIVRFLFEANMFDVDGEPLEPGKQHDPNTGWILVKQHSFIDTKAAPKDKPADSNWPESVGAICRRTPIGADQHPAFPNCYVCDNKLNDRGRKEVPSLQMWASAVLREEVVGNQELVDQGRIAPSQIGKRVIIDQADYVDEYDEHGSTTGKKVWKKRYVIVNQSVANFFSQLTSYADYRKTILDRDYKITRKGEPKAKKVEYVSMAMDPYQVTVMRDNQPVVINYDLREPEIAALYADSKLTRSDLMKIVSRRVSKAYYDRFFDISVEVSWKDMQPDDDETPTNKKGQASSPDAPPPPAVPTVDQQEGKVLTQAPTEGPTADMLAKMREKVMGGASTDVADAPPPVAPEAPAVAPPAVPDVPPAAASNDAPPPLVG